MGSKQINGVSLLLYLYIVTTAPGGLSRRLTCGESINAF